MSIFNLSLEEKWEIVEEKSSNVMGMLSILRDAMFYREGLQQCGDFAAQTEVIISEMKEITALF